jgi:hypothetical protein
MSAKASGKNNSMYGRSPPPGKGSYYYRPSGEKIWLRSTYEVRVANKLTELGIDWVYESSTLFLGELGTYRPDFYLPVYNLWIEVKGHLRPTDKSKMIACNKYYPDLKLRIWYGKDILLLENDNITHITEIGIDLVDQIEVWNVATT